MSFEVARQHFLQGLAELQRGALNEADASFEASLALVPDRVSTLINLGTVRLGLGKNAEALTVLERAAALDPSNVGVWLQCAQLQQEQQRLPEALASLDQALALDAHNGAAWSNRGMLLRDLLRPDEAAASFETAINLGHDAALNAFYLAAVLCAPNAAPKSAAKAAPISAPRAYVEKLFDSYADDFSGHLVQALHYRGHERLVQRLLQLHPRRFRTTLDVGCGTGLCGALIRSHTERLEGLDISAAMVEKARATGLYDRLFHSDAVDHLRAVAAGTFGATPPVYDLILAADVFNYIGALEPLFEAAQAALAGGGQFCFTVEAMGPGHGMGDQPVTRSAPSDPGRPGADDMRLLPSLRYAHAEGYVRRVAAQHDFRVDEIFAAPLREDQGVEIAALYVFLTRTA